MGQSKRECQPVEHFIFFVFQFGFQKFLVAIAAICIPWMWFAKPLWLRHQHRYGQVNVLINKLMISKISTLIWTGKCPN
jgi:hypothetical protein